jgi:RHS repeat-associated protein
VYDAFGVGQRNPSGSEFSEPWGFGAQWGDYTDPETGLVLMTHRYYDPAVGRFLTRDPVSYTGGVNVYDFVKNNPVNQFDPLGLMVLPNEFCEFTPRSGPERGGRAPGRG